MTLIEGIGDEVTNFFIAIFAVLVVCVAWWSTNVNEQGGPIRTVFLLERRRRRRSRLTNHTEAVTITEGTLITEDFPEETAETVEEQTEQKSEEEEAGTSGEGDAHRSMEEDEQSRIVEAMDDNASSIRKRRLQFYENSDQPPEENPTSDTGSTKEKPSSSSLNQANNINSPSSSSDVPNKIESSIKSAPEPPKETKTEQPKDSITIKLKYLNDDLKSVSGKLEEQLGDFKKRNFDSEISSDKQVRLIFNGHVLQQDTQTLQGCGLFDNCVVHCLIHPKRRGQNPDDDDSPINIGGDYSNMRSGLGGQFNNNNNHPVREWDLGNYLFALLSCFLGTAWYLRYVYAHLYTITATVGLILMTGIFTVVVLGMNFPDVNLQQPRRPENVPQSQRQQ